jgi:hypothetical protein
MAFGHAIAQALVGKGVRSRETAVGEKTSHRIEGSPDFAPLGP